MLVAEPIATRPPSWFASGMYQVVPPSSEASTYVPVIVPSPLVHEIVMETLVPVLTTTLTLVGWPGVPGPPCGGGFVPPPTVQHWRKTLPVPSVTNAMSESTSTSPGTSERPRAWSEMVPALFAPGVKRAPSTDEPSVSVTIVPTRESGMPFAWRNAAGDVHDGAPETRVMTSPSLPPGGVPGPGFPCGPWGPGKPCAPGSPARLRF